VLMKLTTGTQDTTNITTCKFTFEYFKNLRSHQKFTYNPHDNYTIIDQIYMILYDKLVLLIYEIRNGCLL